MTVVYHKTYARKLSSKAKNIKIIKYAYILIFFLTYLYIYSHDNSYSSIEYNKTEFVESILLCLN